MALKPDTAIRLRNGVRETVAQRDLRPGDVIEVAAGGRLPADGQLLSPFASFDESALTGESVPVERQAGERVAAGATSVDRLAELTVISEPGDSAIDRILKLIEEAEERRAPIRALHRPLQPDLHPGHYGGGLVGRHCPAAVLRQRLAAVDL